MSQKSFILFASWYEPIKNLSHEEKGLLFDAIFQYHLTGTIPELSPVAAMAFSFMKSGFEQIAMKYEAITERNRSNGIKGGRPKKNPENPVGILETQRNPKNLKYDNDSDNDSDNLLKKENKGWREDFGIYLKLVGEIFNLAINNKEFIKKQEQFSPAIDAKLTIEKAYKKYWSKKIAWCNQKKKYKSDEPDWKSDIERSFDLKSNIVYRARNEDERSRQPIRY